MKRQRRAPHVLLAWLVGSASTLALIAAAAPASQAAPCSSGRGADASLGQVVSSDGSGNSVFTLTVTNDGPACLPGAQVRVDLTGDYLYSTSIDPGSWSCPLGPLPGPVSITCVLTATIGVGAGGDTAVVAVGASAGSTSHAIVGADVIDPDCSPSFFCDGAGSNNENWAVLGTKLKFGPVTPQTGVPSVSITRPNDSSIGGTLYSQSSPSAELNPPCSPNCLTTREWVVETAATGNTKNDLMTMVITVVATAKPTSVIYQFDDGSQTWLTYGACKGTKFLPCVDSVTFDKTTKIATITVLTPHFSHWTK